MKKVVLVVCIALCGFFSPVKAQFITIDPAHIATSILNTASEIVQTASTVTNVINNWKEVEKVYNQGKEYYDALKSVKDLVKDAAKVRDAILLVGEIGDIYVNSYQKMLADPHFTFDELSISSNRSRAISASHNLNGSALGDGMDCIKRKSCSTSATSVL
jgi:hypothetical protein